MKKTPHASILALPTGHYASLQSILPTGSLEAYRTKIGVALNWRYTVDGKTHRSEIGVFDPHAPKNRRLQSDNGGYSLAAAAEKAQAMAARHHDSVTSGGAPYYQLLLDDLARTKAARVEMQAMHTYTTAKMLAIYCDILGEQNKRTGQDVAGLFRKVPQALLERQPCHVTTDDWQALLIDVAAKYPTTANRFRAYLTAAYSLAIKATNERRIDSSAQAHLELARFKLTENPLGYIPPHAGGNNASPNPLTLQELRVYWDCIKEMKGIEGATLRIHLLTGGLRPTQLVRLTADNVELNGGDGVFTLIEAKGRKKAALWRCASTARQYGVTSPRTLVIC